MKTADRKHLNKLAELGCIACYKLGYPGAPCEIHHIRAGTGMGRKATHFEAFGLCPAHHRGTAGLSVASIHGSKNAFIAEFGTEAELLELCLAMI